MTDLTVVGAGLSGLTMARHAADHGLKVLIHERREHIGGNAWTYIHNTGVEVHRYGTHVFHNSSTRVQAFFERFAELNGYRHHVTAVAKGRRYPIPVNLDTIRALADDPLMSPEQARAWVRDQAQETGLTGAEAVGVASVGRSAYDTLIAGYTTKQWGMDPSALPDHIVRRLPVRYTVNRDYFNDTWQGIPRNGYQEFLTRIADHPSIQVRLSSPWSLPACGPTYYTGPLDALLQHRHGRLPWRTVDLEVSVPDADDYQGQAVVNYPDRDTPWTRVHEFKHLAPERDSVGTVIAREYSRAAGPDDEPYYPVLASDDPLVARYREDVPEGLTVGGRLGKYRYYDMHMAIGAAMRDWDDMERSTRWR